VKVSTDARLTTHTHTVTDGTAPGDPTLGGHENTLPDPDVVRDVNEIIQLRPTADPGFAQRTTVNGAVRANLDVVFDNDGTEVWGPPGNVIHNRETEPDTADNRARSNAHLRAD
jgi:hypothetical protein